jgi:hypothetical protein
VVDDEKRGKSGTKIKIKIKTQLNKKEEGATHSKKGGKQSECELKRD